MVETKKSFDGERTMTQITRRLRLTSSSLCKLVGLTVVVLTVYMALLSERNSDILSRQYNDKMWPAIAPKTEHHRVKERTNSKQCKRTTNIVYVKTHKTASSTIQNLITRFSSLQAQQFPRPFFGGYPGTFQQKFIVLRSSLKQDGPRTLHSLAGHFRFNKTEIEATMKKKCKYITIIRNPLAHFESSFNYYYGRFRTATARLNKVSCFGEPYIQVTGKMGAGISEYIELASEKLSDAMPWFFRSSNYQSFDLGMSHKYRDEASIRKYIKQLDDAFDLVMITDYFLESVILLKETLCADWKHLVFKSAQEGYYKKHNFTAHEKELVRQLNKQDFMLYEHFNRTFWRKVDKYGRSRMRRDVKQLKEELKKSEKTQGKKREQKEFQTRKRAKRNLKTSEAKLMPLLHESNEKHIEVLKERIAKECGFCANENITQDVAEFMFDNGGWCPH